MKKPQYYAHILLTHCHVRLLPEHNKSTGPSLEEKGPFAQLHHSPKAERLSTYTQRIPYSPLVPQQDMQKNMHLVNHWYLKTTCSLIFLVSMLPCPALSLDRHQKPSPSSRWKHKSKAGKVNGENNSPSPWAMGANPRQQTE